MKCVKEERGSGDRAEVRLRHGHVHDAKRETPIVARFSFQLSTFSPSSSRFYNILLFSVMLVRRLHYGFY